MEGGVEGGLEGDWRGDWRGEWMGEWRDSCEKQEPRRERESSGSVEGMGLVMRWRVGWGWRALVTRGKRVRLWRTRAEARSFFLLREVILLKREGMVGWVGCGLVWVVECGRWDRIGQVWMTVK